MSNKVIVLAAAGFMLVSCAGVSGPTGNDTGGIIPWSPETESMAMDIAQNNCAAYNKYAWITSVHRVYGDYIGYQCRWNPPRWRYQRRQS